jgi:adenylate cyclase
MDRIAKHWPRIAITLLPLLVSLMHASGLWQFGLLSRLDDLLYDMRVRATMPKTLDPRIVIVDLDERSLAEVGRWPWSRNIVSELTSQIVDKQGAAALAFDIVFAEPDTSSGLPRLRALAQNELKDQPGFAERLNVLSASLDYDALFAASLRGKPVVLGYYLTKDRNGRKAGQLPEPVMRQDALAGKPITFTQWDGYGSNLPQLASAAPLAGFFNSLQSTDGVVRSVPMVAEFEKQYYESLSLATFRLISGLPKIEPGFPQERYLARYQGLESIRLTQDGKSLAIPVDARVGALVPYRGFGGPDGGSFQYISAVDVLNGKTAPGALKGKIVLLGTTAPGAFDLRVTPVGEVYPGVEVHANMISGILDNRVPVQPDYSLGFEVVTLTFAGLILAFALPLFNATRAVVLSVGVLAALLGINHWLWINDLVMPVAASIVMVLTAFALNMSYGYFVESKSKRDLANLFRGYIPPELVDEMVDDPESYNMKAVNKELTVMFCDMRGFTKMSETMEPTQLQGLLNDVFTRLTNVIQANRGTIDKYMGDCVMAFWGAPVETGDHAKLAVKSAVEMSNEVRRINEEHRAKGLPEIGIGIGLNTGTMCVGNMGSEVRRSYTVIGDSVNLGSRLEGLSKTYGVDIVVSESTKDLAPDVSWQELDRVRVKGKDKAVSIYWPLGPSDKVEKAIGDELKTWAQFLRAYRGQDWDQCDVLLLNLERLNAKKFLYQLYSQRVGSMRMLPFDPAWDGATNFETK